VPPVAVRWTARALRDVRGIRDYIGRSSLYARRVAQRLLDRADLLAEHPAAGRAVPEYDRPDIRELVEPPWRILYRYAEGAPAVYVLAVVHGRQQLPGRL
jgi:plasmid stabilization system protein ParE